MHTARDIIESVLEKPSVFKSKEKLFPEYVPKYLPHREQQLKQLASLFKPLLTDPGSISQRALLVGGIGTGKTVTARRFGIDFKLLARRRGVKLEYVHVNCHRDRTLYLVMQEIARQLHIPVPQRGLSAQEMYGNILKDIDERDIYVIITFDEFDYFIDVAGNDAVYFLIRTYDEYPDMTKRINFIFITRDMYNLGKLDSATESYLIRNVIHFEPYTSSELYDILAKRAEEAFYEGTIGDDVIQYVADIVGVDKGGRGNARLALEILLIAGELADQEGAQRVTIEHVRRAYVKAEPDIVVIYDSLLYLPLHELLILLAAIRALSSKGEAYVRIGEVEQEYQQICEEFNEKPRRHTQVYEYVMDLKRLGIIDARVSGRGYRGKSTLIGVRVGPLEALEEKVLEIINKRYREARRM
ncbi:MAG: ORC1-type DNA replication protein [Crenarchaeota archaeon]|nr:ORC1-type DNA replication protein [Thermoproteota archaeon]